MLAQPNCAKTPSAALNIAELADRYASLLYGIGRATGSPRRNATTRHNRPGWRCVKTPTTSAIRSASLDGWPPPCAGSPPQHSGAGTGSCPPPTPAGLFHGTRDSRVGASDNGPQTEMLANGRHAASPLARGHLGQTDQTPLEAATLSMTRIFPDRFVNGSRSLRQVAQERAAEGRDLGLTA
jgi:hypothetical protein